MDRDGLRQFSDLIECIYRGATEPEAWADILAGVADWMQSPMATLFTPLHTPAMGGFMRTHNLDAVAMETWATTFHALDPWAQRAQAIGFRQTGAVLRDQELLPVEALQQTAFYEGFLKRLGVGRLATGLVFGVDEAGQQSAMPVLCSCNREIPRPYEEEDLFRLRLVMPHLSRALGVLFRLRQADFQQACSLSALDLLPQATMLFDGAGNLFHMNPAAARHIACNDGFSLSGSEGYPGKSVLCCADPGSQQVWRAALDTSLRPDALHTTHFAAAIMVRRPSGLPAYAVRMATLPPRNEFARGHAQAMAIAFIDDGAEAMRFDPDLLRARYDLTTAEARVAEAAAHGMAVKELAHMLGVTANTVKTHLNRVYAKTGVVNRAQLLKLMMALRLANQPEAGAVRAKGAASV
jgi:DNA-binding CsgD family transcriptional regulator